MTGAGVCSVAGASGDPVMGAATAAGSGVTHFKRQKASKGIFVGRQSVLHMQGVTDTHSDRGDLCPCPPFVSFGEIRKEIKVLFT